MNELPSDGRPGAAAKLSLTRFIERRLGTGGWNQTRNWIGGTFGARSLSEFWRTWNPVYGYFLYYYSYRPLRRLLPRAPAVLLTFAACGFFLHDLVGWILVGAIRFPVMTIAFGLFGLGMVITEAMRFSVAGWPFLLRAIVNVGYVLGCLVLASHLPR
jgi:hypothetical protein